MTEENARQLLGAWAREPVRVLPAEAEPPIRIYEPKRRSARPEAPRKRKPRLPSLDQIKRRYGILLIAAAAFTIYTIILSSCIEASTEKRVWTEAKAQYAAQLEEYKAQQAYEAQAEHWLSGDASREAFINQEILAGAKLIAKEANDEIKGTKLGVAIARMKNSFYPETIQEVAAQPNQFMFYSEDNTYTQHDWDLAESMIRPLYEQGMMPNGLTDQMVYFEWSGNTGTARDSYETTTSMRTWRYQG
jgi:hypothetical protein